MLVRFFRSGLPFAVNIITALVSVASFTACFVPPDVFMPAGFAALLTPVVIPVNFFFVVFWAFRKSWRFLLSLFILAGGYPFLQSTFAWNFDALKSKKNATDTLSSFSVLSYNVRVLNLYQSAKNNPDNSSEKLVRFLLEDNSDIKCLQEAYQSDTSKTFDLIGRMQAAGYPHHVFSSAFINKAGGEFGMALFSKFPILKTKALEIETDGNNQIVYTDLLIRNDTVRVYNLHLESMSISEDKIIWEKEADKSLRYLYQKLKKGFTERSKQVRILSKHIEDCPYPVVICGDFNDTPYSFTYRSVRKNLKNAFEAAGSGFGFTYKGRVLSFLRIDNQFFGNGIRASDFKTLKNVKYSDHFPIKANYCIIDKK